MLAKLRFPRLKVPVEFSQQDSSLPAAVFVWEVQNASRDELDVSVTFTFKNGQGAPEDALGGVWSSAFSHKTSARGRQRVSGVMIHQEFNDLPCTYAIAAKDKVRASWNSESTQLVEVAKKSLFGHCCRERNPDCELETCRFAEICPRVALCEFQPERIGAGDMGRSVGGRSARLHR